MVVLREGHIHLNLLIDLCADQLLFKPRNESAGTNGQIVVLTLAALESHTVHKAFKIQNRHIPVLHRPVGNFNIPCVALPFFTDFLVNFLIAYAAVKLLQLDPLIFAKLHLRLDGTLRRKNKRLSFLNLYHINLRRRHNILPALFQRILIGVRKHFIYRILVKNFRSVHLLYHLTGNLPLTKAGNIYSVLILQKSALKRLLHLVSGNLNRQLCHVFFQFLYLYAHPGTSSLICPFLK